MVWITYLVGIMWVKFPENILLYPFFINSHRVFKKVFIICLKKEGRELELGDVFRVYVQNQELFSFL